MTDALVHLLRACRAAEVVATVEDVVDAAWLVQWMERVPAVPVAVPQSPEPKEPDTRPVEGQALRPPGETEARPEAVPPAAPAEAPRSVELSVPTTTNPSGGRSGQTFWAAAAPALPRPLEIARALRPLVRRVPSRTHFVLDENETVRRFAEERVCDPALRPTAERWLRLALVVDAGTGADLWRDTVREFRALLACLGAFRDVRTWSLDTNASPPRLVPGRGANPGATARRPKELADPTGRTLVIVLSPFITPGWYDGTAFDFLRLWAVNGPVVLVPLLPEYLWSQTALANGRGVRLTGAAGAPNARLRAELLRAWPGDETPPGASFPLTVLEPAALRRWAGLVAGQSDAPGLLFAPRGATAPTPGPGPAPTAPQRVDRFWQTSSPLASRLAGLLAAAAVVNLPILRLVRQSLLPEAGQPHEAEVLFGGLLRRAPGEDANDPQFEFHPGVRELLLDAAPTDESLTVLEAVSDYLGEHLASGRTFKSVIADPTSAAGELGLDDSPFARIAAEVFRRAGGDLARVVRHVSRPPAGEVAPPTPESRASLAPETPPAEAETPAAPSAPADVTAGAEDAVPPATPRARRAVALVIGIGRYAHPDLSPIPFANADAEALAVLLTDPEVCGFPRNQVALLTGAGATQANVIRRLTEWLPARCHGAEIAFIHFVGHGLYGAGDNTWDGYLLAQDSDPNDPTRCGVAMSELSKLIGRLQADTVILSLDVSHVGTAPEWADIGTELPVVPDPAPSERGARPRPAPPPKPAWRSSYWLVSCEPGEQPIANPELGHGLFTYYLMKGISGDADLNADGRVGVAELMHYVPVAVTHDARELGVRQTPWNAVSSPGDEYISVVRPRTAPAAAEPARPKRARTAGEALGDNLPCHFGRYTLLRQLGSGSVGVTYLARDPSLDRDVALKVPHAGAGSDSGTRSEFDSGYRLAVRLNRQHRQNVPHTFDVRNDVRRCPCVTMEYIPGEHLSVYWKRERERLGPSGLAEHMCRVARLVGLVNQALPREMPAHGNLKPANILVYPTPDESKPQVVILDYGFAPVVVPDGPRVVGEAGAAAFAYLPPERLVPGWNGHAVTERSDVYSLGVVLFELIAGRLPIETRNWNRLVDSVLNGYVWVPSETTTGYQPFDEVCLKATARNPADRYASLAEFADALEATHFPPPWHFERQPAPEPAPTPSPPAAEAASLPAARVRAADEALLAETVLRCYPAPIALAYRRFAVPEQPLEGVLAGALGQVYALVQVFETTTAYLTFLATSDLLRSLQLPASRIASLRPFAAWTSGGRQSRQLPAAPEFDFTRHPRAMWLGQWLEALRGAVNELRPLRDNFIPELAAACSTEVFDPLQFGDLMSWGGTQPSVEECTRFLREFRPRLSRFLREVSFVQKYPLGFFTHHEEKRPSPKQRLEVTNPAPAGLMVHSWMGAGVARGPQSRLLQRQHRFPIGIPFVLASDGATAMCLWPFLSQLRTHTGREALYTFQGIDNGGSYLNWIKAASVLDPGDQRKIRLHESEAANHDWLWAALGRLPQVFAVPAELELSKLLTELLDLNQA